MKKQRAFKSSKNFYKFLKYCAIASLSITVLVLVAVIIYIFASGISNLSLSFLFGSPDEADSIIPALIGTLRLVFVSIIFAVPIGIFSAIFLVEYMRGKGKLVTSIRLATETLAGMPSIVYGLFGYLVFVVALKMGYTLLGGAITLSIMILPTIIRSTEESLLAVPNSYREGAFALGASKVRTIFKVILPSASSGIVSAIILAIGRVVSESAVLILTIGLVVNEIPVNMLSPGTSLAINIYYYACIKGQFDIAAATAVVLLVFVLALNLLAFVCGRLIKKKYEVNL